MNKKIITIVTALSILGTSTILLGITSNVKENGNLKVVYRLFIGYNIE